MITILDYGMGNLSSVEKACRHLGYQVTIQTDLKNVSKLIIPGVGAFARAMENLAPLKSEIVSFARGGNPVFGICLGQQLLFDSSEEFGQTAGLGIIPGAVKYLPKEFKLKVPHMGWSPVQKVHDSGPLLNIPDQSQVYFVHSLYTVCQDEKNVVGWTEYGTKFASVVQHDNVWATQFHPEKSGPVGLQILENFLKCS